MMVEIPEPVAKLLPDDPELRAKRVLESLVIDANSRGLISRGRAGELMGLDYWGTDQFFSERGVHMNYDFQEFQRDLAK